MSDADHNPNFPDTETESSEDYRLSDWRLPQMSNIEELDLAGVLQHLNRVTAGGRRRAAQDPVTRALLQAGLRMLEMAVVEPADRPTPIDPPTPPFLTWLSRARVVSEVPNTPADSKLPRVATEASMRDRWEPHSNYLADLLLVALNAENWGRAVSDNDEYFGAMEEASDLPATVHEVCYQDIVALENSPGFRVQLLTTAISANAPYLRESLKSTYDGAAARRAEGYAKILEKQGLPMRPGFSAEVLADLFTALAEGLAMRAIADPTSRILDHEKRESLLGTGVLAIVMSAADLTGSGISVEDLMRLLQTPQ